MFGFIASTMRTSMFLERPDNFFINTANKQISRHVLHRINVMSM